MCAAWPLPGEAPAPLASDVGTCRLSLVSRVRLVLVDRPGSRGSSSVLAGAVEGSALAGEVEVRFTSGPSAVAAAAREAEDRGLRAVCGWPFL